MKVMLLKVSYYMCCLSFLSPPAEVVRPRRGDGVRHAFYVFSVQ